MKWIRWTERSLHNITISIIERRATVQTFHEMNRKTFNIVTSTKQASTNQPTLYYNVKQEFFKIVHLSWFDDEIREMSVFQTWLNKVSFIFHELSLQEELSQALNLSMNLSVNLKLTCGQFAKWKLILSLIPLSRLHRLWCRWIEKHGHLILRVNRFVTRNSVKPNVQHRIVWPSDSNVSNACFKYEYKLKFPKLFSMYTNSITLNVHCTCPHQFTVSATHIIQ